MPQVGFLELLRTNRNVRWLWAGAVVSLFGDWFNTLALYRVVQDLSSEGSVLGDGYVALALVFVVKLLPHAQAAPAVTSYMTQSAIYSTGNSNLPVSQTIPKIACHSIPRTNTDHCLKLP